MFCLVNFLFYSFIVITKTYGYLVLMQKETIFFFFYRFWFIISQQEEKKSHLQIRWFLKNNKSKP